MVLPRLLFGLFASALGIHISDKASDSNGSRKKLSRREAWSNDLDARSFALGVAIGMTLYGICSSQIRKHKIRERIRQSYIAWARRLRQSSTPLAGMPYAIMSYLFQSLLEDEQERQSQRRTTTTSCSLSATKVISDDDVKGVLQLETIPIGLNCPNATKRILGSPSLSLTSTLHCCLITIPSNSQLRSREARGVEIYYVLDGSSVLCRDCEEDVRIRKGDTFIVNPFVQRHVINKGRNDLVFLRVSDGGSECDDDEFDVVVKLAMARRRTADLVLEAFSMLSDRTGGNACSSDTTL